MISIFLRVQSLILKLKTILLKILILILKKIFLEIKIMIQDLKGYHHQAKMGSQQLIKEFLPLAKKMTNVLHGKSKLIKSSMMKVRNK